MQPSDLLTTEEVARAYRVEARTVRNWHKRGVHGVFLQVELAGGLLRHRRDYLDEFHRKIAAKRKVRVGRGSRQRRRDQAADDAALTAAGLRFD